MVRADFRGPIQRGGSIHGEPGATPADLLARQRQLPVLGPVGRVLAERHHSPRSPYVSATFHAAATELGAGRHSPSPALWSALVSAGRISVSARIACSRFAAASRQKVSTSQ